MTTNEIIAQIIGIPLIAMTLLSPHLKTRSGILFFILFANCLACIQFYFVDARAGLFGLIVTTVRSVVYWGYSCKNKKAPLIVLIFFILAQIVATFIGWSDWASALTLALLFNTYGQWQANEKRLRICLLINALFIGIYCFHIHAYTGAINKLLQAGSTVLALYRAKISTQEASH